MSHQQEDEIIIFPFTGIEQCIFMSLQYDVNGEHSLEHTEFRR